MNGQRCQNYLCAFKGGIWIRNKLLKVNIFIPGLNCVAHTHGVQCLLWTLRENARGWWLTSAKVYKNQAVGFTSSSCGFSPQSLLSCTPYSCPVYVEEIKLGNVILLYCWNWSAEIKCPLWRSKPLFCYYAHLSDMTANLKKIEHRRI